MTVPTQNRRVRKPPAYTMKRVYDVIYDSYIRTGVVPSIREIAREAGLRSSSHALGIIRKLVHHGLVTNVQGKVVPTDILRLPPRCPHCSIALHLEVSRDGTRPRRLEWKCHACGYTRHVGR